MSKWRKVFGILSVSTVEEGVMEDIELEHEFWVEMDKTIKEFNKSHGFRISIIGLEQAKENKNG